MSYSKIYIHAVWSTKNRVPCLSREIRKIVIDHIRNNSADKGIYIDTINTHIDHVHCLISLGRHQNVSEVIRLIKGESSNWINKQGLVDGRFSWQREYYAVSVNPLQRLRVIRYIRDQEEHHKKITYQDEYEDLKRQIEMESPC